MACLQSATEPAAGESLPMLLGARRRAPGSPRKLRRKAPAALVIPEESATASGHDVRVKNTFLEGAVPRSPSLERFYRERAVRTCPSKHVGRLTTALLQEAAGLSNGRQPTATVPSPLAAVAEDGLAFGSPLASPYAIQTPCSLHTPRGLGSATQAGWLLSTTPEMVIAGGAPDLGLQYTEASMYHAGYWPAPLPYPGGDASGFAAQQHFDCLGVGSPQVLSLTEALPYDPPATFFAPYQGSSAPAHYADFLSAPLAAAAAAAPSSSAPAAGRPPARPPSEPPAFPSDATPGESSAQPPPPPSGPAPGSSELPSVGSAEHAEGTCKPCAFVHKKGCENGLSCKFCHLCGPDEIKRRRKERLELRKAAMLQAGAAADSTPPSAED